MNIIAAALLLREDAVFLARRGPSQSHAGMWELPGGKVESGETPEQALVREIREELNWEIRCGELRARSTSPDLPGLELQAFACEIVGGALELHEHEASAWVPWSELDRYPMTALDRELIPQLQGTSSCQG